MLYKVLVAVKRMGNTAQWLRVQTLVSDCWGLNPWLSITYCVTSGKSLTSLVLVSPSIKQEQ